MLWKFLSTISTAQAQPRIFFLVTGHIASSKGSFRLRGVRFATRLLIRRRDWGPQHRLVQRARRLFGAPRAYAWLRSLGVRITPSRDGEPVGEWLIPRKPARQTILYLHGGGYVSCTPATHRPITAALARLTPARVFSLAYRLAPEHPYPAALDDADRAYRWLLASGISPSSIAVAGDSAGGGLALALLFRMREAGVPLPACAVLFSPWTDLTGSGASVRENDGKCAMFRPENTTAFANCYAPLESWRDAEVSPVFGQFTGLPPTLIHVGAEELLRDDAVRIRDRLSAVGVPVGLVVYEGVFHCWQMLDGIVPEARHSLQAAARFMAQLPPASFVGW